MSNLKINIQHEKKIKKNQKPISHTKIQTCIKVSRQIVVKYMTREQRGIFVFNYNINRF